MDRIIFIPCDDFSLEARITEGSSNRGAILCHPHPLYGGDMDNTVVMVMKKGFMSANFTVLRFNFRGVGASGGTHGEGKHEISDVIACYDFLKQKGVEDVWLGGYSFGAWVALRAISEVKDRMKIKGFVMVAPPVDFLDFSRLSIPDLPSLIVVGSSDQLCNPGSLRKWLRDKTVRLVTVNGADHFFFHGLHEIEAAISEFLISTYQGKQ